MLQKPLIPLSLVRDLRCRQCEKFVSCGPVYVVPDTSILCGRCRHLAKDIHRNSSYEALGSMFMYPCYNWENYCSRTLHWNESLQHEEECSYNGCCKVFWHHPRAYFKGKREIPEGDIRLTPVPEQLLDHIKCVQCECYLTCDPVYIQTNGKNVCHRCIHANGIPPNCLRNIAYEKISTIIVFPCIYRNRGCPTRLKFGRSLWQHEAECSYGQTFKKISKNPNQKEKGVIKTHSGHYYGTLTPNGVLFAPPSEKSEFDVNKELLKSLKKQQERKFIRADEIGTQLERFNSEDGSVCTEDSDKNNSYNKSSSSDRSSPSRLDENDRQRQAPTHLITVEPGYFSNRSSQIIEESYQPNSYIVPIHQEYYPTPRPSPNPYNKGYYPSNAIYANTNGLRDYNDGSVSPKPSITRKNHYNIDNNALAGHYPVFGFPGPQLSSMSPIYIGSLSTSPLNGLSQTPFSASLQYSPSFNGGYQRFSFNNADHKLSRTESMNSNKELIEELKVKLMKHNSMKAAVPATDNPYKECNSLEDILQTRDKINK